MSTTYMLVGHSLFSILSVVGALAIIGVLGVVTVREVEDCDCETDFHQSESTRGSEGLYPKSNISLNL